ncbi:hypothetical protein EW093_16480 [Thiospirochaeta perfilievii]|uniref:DUF5050 domain-containing protein n=1 Tax=Thiospirochaeta perfilievii TaxID=252967 RepID=A0A5C1QDR5_9SPIO|nr:hypothetical protein [Thiospirochaeta perfilievii]QEN06215.1 hypothetical protein EW093_16480 [Thiospirochaeta perfilievii]
MKILLILLLIALDIFPQKIVKDTKNYKLNDIFFDIDSDGFLHIPSMDSKTISIIKSSKIIKTITLSEKLLPKNNYFEVKKSEYLIYNNYVLYLFNRSGSLMAQRNFPIGCIPKFIYSDNDFIYLELPEIYNKDKKTVVLDSKRLLDIGRLGDKENYPMFILKEKILPINYNFFNKGIDAYYIGNSGDYLYWIDRLGNRIVKSKTSQSYTTIELEDNMGFKYYRLKENILYYMTNSDETLIINRVFLD